MHQDILLIGPSINDSYGPAVGFKYLIQGLEHNAIRHKVISGKNTSLFNIRYILRTKNIYIITLSNFHIALLVFFFPYKNFILGADISLQYIPLFSWIMSRKNVLRVFNTQEMLDYYTGLYTRTPYNPPVVHGHGIDTSIKTTKQSTNDVFVYFKSVNALTHERTHAMKDKVIEFIEDQGISYTYIAYGSYTFDQREEILRTCKLGIFVTSIEGYGLAKLEALKYDIPMLNFEQHDCVTKRGDIQHNRSTFPIFKPEYGECFETYEEFVQQRAYMQERLETYAPRDTVLAHHDYVLMSHKLFTYYTDKFDV